MSDEFSFDGNFSDEGDSFCLADPFETLGDLHKKVEEGEISGFTNWPDLTGVCTVKNVAIKEINGKSQFVLTLKHKQHGTKDFNVRIPSSADKDTAKYMAMQNIYKTIYVVADCDTDVIPKHAFEVAVANTEEEPNTEYKYTLRTWEKIGRNGQTFVNQNLDCLEYID